MRQCARCKKDTQWLATVVREGAHQKPRTCVCKRYCGCCCCVASVTADDAVSSASKRLPIVSLWRVELRPICTVRGVCGGTMLPRLLPVGEPDLWWRYTCVSCAEPRTPALVSYTEMGLARLLDRSSLCVVLRTRWGSYVVNHCKHGACQHTPPRRSYLCPAGFPRTVATACVLGCCIAQWQGTRGPPSSEGAQRR